MNILFKLLEPLLVIVEDRKHSLLRFMLVIVLYGYQTELIVGKYSATKLSE
jgi:hypothetical protein